MDIPIATAALTVAGLMVGVEFCVAVFVNPILDRLPDDDGLLGRADGARVLGRVMPFWYAASIVLAALTAALAWPGPGAAAAIAAAALLTAAVLMSVLLLVPINDRAKGWAPGHAPADWREQFHRWDRLHLVRLAGITAAVVLLAVGALQAQ